MKTGDTVRFLNDVGGGVITRIEGKIAYVEDADGFEQPMALNECVLVPSAKPDPVAAEPKPAAKAAPKPAPAPAAPRQKAAGFNVALLFEPQDIRRLSQTKFDVYLVNDTNYTVCFAVSTRDRLDSEWTLFAAGEAEPCTQAFLDEVMPTDLNRFENIAVQIVSYKTDAPFELRPPIDMNLRFDATRLAKLHCFTPTAYSTTPVLTVPVATNGRTYAAPEFGELVQHYAPGSETAKKDAPKPAPKAARKNPDDPEVIDLHASELLDSTAGLQAGEILALQLEVFERAMRAAEKTPGKKLIFIHGKGEGVLRHALLDRLRRRWPRCEAQDASFREYGFGATQITIRK